ncbi:MAG: hypothetical protein DMD91_11250 [Candidatus Rokuibacteriota bacterium]|nr:MAG: hypothetical protein DMD91_11250 [Candidatus Rokubacteria bacterium]
MLRRRRHNDEANQPVRILGIAGSLRRASYNRAALRAAIALVPEGATLDVFELHDIPGFNQDDEGNPPSRVINRPEVMIGKAAARFDAEGNLKDETTAGLIRDLLRNLVAWTRQLGRGGVYCWRRRSATALQSN